jgi:transcriptional regulator with XRE-family HTH domain
MDQEVLARAKKMAQKESLNIRLAMLREKYGVKQSEIAAFTQTAVSKLENRKDIRISTLIDYLDSLGMGLEITACPKNSNEKELLLRIFGIEAAASNGVSMIDERDRKFYDAAKTAGAILITGNSRHYPDELFIVTPAAFVQRYYSEK